MPALAVAGELRARGAHVEFAGGERIEAQLVPEAGYVLHRYPISGFPRKPSPRLVAAMWRAGRAPFRCRRIIRDVRPDVVFGAGGYASGPVLAAARSTRVPAALLEVDAHMGLANRMAAPLVDRVFLSFPIDGKRPPHYVVTGRPLPRASDGAPDLALNASRPMVLVFGGSLGARTLNEAATGAWAAEDPGFDVVHITGPRDLDRFSGAASDRYHLIGYTPHLRAYLEQADLVVARAGGSVFEIAAAGKPAILVPSPNVTADHQTMNAEHFALGGAAVLVPDGDLTPTRLRQEVQALLADHERRERMAAAARQLARPDAAAVIADGLLELAR
ncbi:MAG TPA: UDP-N-acetylglucosamine--N-acetylmuramyl-(pentapeptide) pyrophosphoryl-undecaprenol N-acetylglucosamine transferase [Gaiellales bacterium]|nr:UDP-N-acetylglucosamine--N-acetylmuramyl-(pentapeptide) pyrophosphoryl-undecaprenol N-acetylglucosamine transferase [Gaiellales bacterium]